MPRTKGSKNKKLVEKVLTPLSNFKSMEVKETKTEVFEVAISKSDIEKVLFETVKQTANFQPNQLFEKEEIRYDKKGNAFITLTNPITLNKAINKIQNEESKVVNEFGGK